ncbi:hypothetical protein C8A03DRAFT_11074 [Achaetomium macrosporum]|uniref:Copper-fist domain-containing protein n=1 Tax=Achaetomium macrosporum TaxID=79813 RepID=A0AAN7CIP9_9PEZI|nr:hypothetical protein C8A03DRAFT_11074 [Achaetomium macrosporum]
MPIINGQKMACAPCIRGHRSTKCNHFYERVMLPVRKPGRPLSSCPCPPGRPCVCGGVRVAIPKKQKCGCPTEAAKETEKHEKEPSPAETPTSPTRQSFRVAKPNGSKASTRKHSVDLVNLERMDPNSINVISATSNNGNSNGSSNGKPTPSNTGPQIDAPQTDVAGFQPPQESMPAGPGNAYGSPQSSSYGSPVPYSMGLQYAQAGQFQHAMLEMENGGLYQASTRSLAATMPPPFINGCHTATPLNSPPQAAMPSPSSISKTNGVSSQNGSCCTNEAQVSHPTPNAGMVSQQGYGQSFVPQPPAASCCGSKAQSQFMNTSNVPTPHQQQQVYGQTFMPQFQYPTVFTYPGDYGSWQHPIDPRIWQQVAAQTSMQVSLGAPMAPLANGGGAGEVGTSHQCNCGEGCQCVGCLAHPFNAQMFQYVNNAYSGSNGSSPGAADTSGGGGGGGGGGGEWGQQQMQTVAAGHESPVEAPTPAASEGSPPLEEQFLSTMDYFFVNLPISGLCGGSLESCPCGDSCNCPGCLVHNVPLQQA